MTILVTGAAGFLGQAVCKALSDAGLGVTPAHRSDGMAGIKLDLGDPDAVWSALNQVKPSAIINCAARTGFSNETAQMLYPVNALLPALLSKFSADHGTYLIHVSGTLVHGVHTSRITPESALLADTEYGVSKLLADHMIQASGCRSMVIRFGGLFGRRGPDHLSLNRTIRAAAEGEVPKIIGQGSGKRNYLHVDDAAAMILDCLKSERQGVAWAGGKQILSVREMIEAICEVYLQGQAPIYVDGPEAADQIVETSDFLPLGRDFIDALRAEC